MNFFFDFFNVWKVFLSKKNNLFELVLTFIFSCFFLVFFREFLILVESWDHNLGVFNDPFFILDPVDLSIPIFLITYSTMGFFVFYNIKNPDKLVYLIQVVVILLFLRAISLFFIRLDADPNMIVLQDPFLNTFMYQINEETGTYNQHDLFFSGHTANLFLVSILFKNKKLKYIFLTLTFLMAICLVLQRAHYSIDVIFAPAFSLLAIYIHKKIKCLE